MPGRRRLARTLALTCGLVFVFFVLASGHVRCGFARVTHVPCPGCGSTRAMLALAHGDLGGMFHANPLAPLFTACVAVLGVQALASMARTGSIAGVGHGAVGRFMVRALVVVAVLEVAVWLARFTGFLGGPVPV